MVWVVPCHNTRAFSCKNHVFPPIKRVQTHSFPPGKAKYNFLYGYRTKKTAAVAHVSAEISIKYRLFGQVG